jgi:hypothetical protein
MGAQGCEFCLPFSFNFFLLTFHRHHRPQRCREKHAIEDFEPHYRGISGHDPISQKSGSCPKIPINGRVASLLEVGTGFHPELSGRAGRQNYIMDNPEKKR